MTLHLLTIAIDRYRHWPILRGAERGAAAFTDILKSGFGVRETDSVELYGSQATVAEIERVLRAYMSDGLCELTDDDRLVIYFAGHGLYDAITENGCLIPMEAVRPGTAGTITYDFLARALRAIRARHILVIADACFSGSGLRSAPASESPTVEIARRRHAMASRLLLTSGGLEPVADSGFGGCSPFTWALVETLRRFDGGWLSSEDLFRDIRDTVVINASQTPEFGYIHGAGHQGGDFFWRRSDDAEAGHPGDIASEASAVFPAEPQGLQRRTPVEPDEVYVAGAITPQDVAEALTQGVGRRALITGMAGVGKTELAMQCLEALKRDAFRSVQFLDLGALRGSTREGEPRHLLIQLIGLFGGDAALPGTISDLRAEWLRIADRSDVLLIFDDVADEAEWKAIRPSRSATALVTSRLRLAGFRRAFALEPMTADHGVDLALQIGNFSDPDRLSPALAGRLHTACDGLPLAIRVAAAALDQAPFLDAEAFVDTLARVDEDLPRTDDWERRVERRLRLSLETVPPEQLHRWALTALFRSRFQRGALRTLWNVPEPEPHLHPLLIRHLLLGQRNPLPSGEAPVRYRLHDLMRPIARDLLSRSALEIEEARRRILKFFREITAELDRLSKRPGRLDLRDHHFLFSQAIEDIRSSIDFAKADHEWESAEALVTFAMSESVSRRLPTTDRLELVDSALQTIFRWVNERPDEAERFRRKLLFERAAALRGLSRPEEAEACLREGLAAAGQDDNNPDKAAFWGNLGSLLLSQPKRTEEALHAFRSALRHLDKESAPQERSALLNNCGNAFLRLGNVKAAKDAYWISRSIDEELGDEIGVATSLGNLANIAVFEGHYTEARSLANQAAEIEEAHGLPQARAQSLQILGKACFLGGDFPAARTAYVSALEIHETQGELISATKARAHVAAADLQAGAHDQAYASARQAIRIAHGNGHIGEAAGAMRIMAMVLLETGRLRSAFRTIRCALAYHSASHNRSEMIEDVLALTHLFRVDQQPDVASRYLSQAEGWAQDHGYAHHLERCALMRQAIEVGGNEKD